MVWMSAVTMNHTGVGVVCLWLSAAMCVVHGESHYVNVAQNKTYRQSSSCFYLEPSSNAANGDTGGVYSYTNCIHTFRYDYNSWWEVDLGRTYPVYNMDVWARDGFQARLYSNITVDGQWCASIDSNSFPNNTTRKKEVTCPTIIYGRTVRVTRHKYTYTWSDPDSNTLNLCEVQIWDCQAGWYGKQCDMNCSVGCEDAVCDRQTGNCSECKADFYGASCHLPCQYQCLNKECIKDSGLCEVCPGNFQGDTCSDCQAGWYGKQCNITCPVGCEDAVCDRQTGNCSECKAGFYGASCNESCQYQCLNNECTRDTGLCEACPENYQGNTCSECETGFFGPSCIECPPLCVNNTCDKTTGRCAVCPDGYRGDTCSECNSGFYGPACNVPCQYQCLNNECTRDTGLCEDCPENYQGNTCSECNAGFYGASCNVSCQYQCLNNECTRETGLCEACPENYQGSTCSAVTDTTPVIVGVAVSVIVFILIIVIVPIVIFIRRRHHNAKSRAQESSTCNTAQNSGELGQPERAGSSPLSFAPVIATGGRPASTADRGQTSAVSQGTEDGPEHYEPVDMSEQNERVDYEPVDMADAENGVHSDDLTATSHKTEADSANPYDTPAVQYHNTGDVHLYDSWGKPQAFQ
ncbi:uncharacterized protein LOC143295800 isoform X2 [Babylonia areolata]|uniref:uncharacterized protein LOC143295800 isoform X2 n=1 Tax=Babylonia areolata TaxID=304850 RepID=UPI003FD4972C